MQHRKTPFLLAFGMITVLLALFIAACGSSSSTGSSGTTPTTSTPTATSTTGSAGAVIKTANATVKGKSVTILTNDKGMTLYYFTPDTPTKSACTGACASIWPALLFSGSGSPTSATSLPGNLTVVQDAHGAQVEYNGHPLYTYSGDTAPGQTNGEGLFGKWFVATTTLAAASAPQQATPTTSSGY
jgi:predicted lipoprotein with Yx(FWY)xxD motif